MANRSLWDRMKGAAALDIDVFEEVEHDETATGQAAAVIAMVAVASAVGLSGEGLIGMLGGVANAIVGWMLWAGITYLIGDKLFGGTATWGELLRTLGFASAPGLLFVLGVVPVLGALLSLVVLMWIWVAGVVAVRQALDFSTGKAALTVVLAFIPYMIARSILSF